MTKEQLDFFKKIEEENKQPFSPSQKKLKFRILAILFHLIVPLFFWSYRIKIHFADEIGKQIFTTGKPTSIIAFWHEFLFLMIPFIHRHYVTRKIPFFSLVSASADGGLITQLLRPWGFRMIRGSSNRKGLQAIKNLRTALCLHCHVLLTPDGPKGPKNKIKGGISYLSLTTQVPIIPMRYEVRQRPWRLKKSWDQTIIPRPFSTIDFIIGPAILPDRKISRIDFIKKIESQMNQSQLNEI